MEYFARINDRRVKLLIDLSLASKPGRRDVLIEIRILEDEQWISIESSRSYDDCYKNNSVHIRGFYRSDVEELQIEDIRSGVIESGQNFFENCIMKIRGLEENMKSVFLANVNHGRTYSLIKDLHSKSLPISSDLIGNTKPLMSGLSKCGFGRQEVVLEGTFYYGLRAFRADAP